MVYIDACIQGGPKLKRRANIGIGDMHAILNSFYRIINKEEKMATEILEKRNSWISEDFTEIHSSLFIPIFNMNFFTFVSAFLKSILIWFIWGGAWPQGVELDLSKIDWGSHRMIGQTRGLLQDREVFLLHAKIKVMRVFCWIFGAQWRSWIFNSKLRVGRKSGRIFTQGI